MKMLFAEPEYQSSILQKALSSFSILAGWMRYLCKSCLINHTLHSDAAD